MRHVAHAAVLATVLTSGCTVFSDYNAATEDAREAFLRGDFAQATEEYSDDLDAANDSLLYHVEAGLSAHVGKDYARSIELFDGAYEIVEEYQDRAIVSASDVAQTVGSFLVNEKTIPYTGAVFEQLMIQAYQARNRYLAGRRDEVLTEILRSYRIQERARKIYEDELRAANSQASSDAAEAGIDPGEVDARLREAYAGPRDLSDAGDVYDPHFMRYLNAFLRDAVAIDQADYNDAFLDLRKLAQRFGKVEFVRRDLARLARLAGAPDVAASASRGLREAIPRDAGSIALFFESGQAPYKKELKITFPTAHGAASVAMPLYEPIPDPVEGAELIVGGRSARTVLLTNLESVAFRYFRDRIPLMVAKQIIRLAAKIGLQEGGHAVIKNQGKTTKKKGLVTLLAFFWDVSTSVWNVVSEQADLRCWRTLPRTLQATRIYLPPGDHPARLRLLGAGGQVLREVDLGTVRIAAGKHRLLEARSIGTSVYWDLAKEPYDAAGAPTGGAPVAAEEERGSDPERTRDVLSPEPDAAEVPEAPPRRGEVAHAEPLAGGEELSALAEAFPAGGPLNLTLTRRGGPRWSGNLWIEGSEVRDGALVLTTAPFAQGGRELAFVLEVVPGRLRRVDLVDCASGRRVSEGTFFFRPRGAVQQRAEEGGLHLASAGLANARRGSARAVPAVLHLRAWHRRGAKRLGRRKS
ncbi:MAG: hypothetical protein D6731_11845 [Planctomycetota bacterium]|nr:MAG: hypothetical protein D6731_11845 [Planctomycetota bacterium]